jgi:hypothetical protein
MLFRLVLACLPGQGLHTPRCCAAAASLHRVALQEASRVQASHHRAAAVLLLLCLQLPVYHVPREEEVSDLVLGMADVSTNLVMLLCCCCCACSSLCTTCRGRRRLRSWCFAWLTSALTWPCCCVAAAALAASCVPRAV